MKYGKEEYCRKVLDYLLEETYIDKVAGISVIVVPHIPSDVPLQYMDTMFSSNLSTVKEGFNEMVSNVYGLKEDEVVLVRERYVKDVKERYRNHFGLDHFGL